MSSFSGFDMSVLGSVLAAQFGYAPGASTPAAGASRTATNNRPLSAAELSKLPPWDSRQPKVAQAIEVSRILAAKSILDPGAASLKNGRLSVESDIKKLFTVHKAMDRLQTLSEAAARNGISGSEKNRITDRFNRGLKELDEFMSRMKMHKVDLIKGRRNDKLETEQFKAAAGVLQGQNLDVSGPTVAVADFANAPPFDMIVTTEAGATTLTFDFNEMGTTVRSLDNVAGYMNSKLAAEGFSTRVRSEYKLDLNTGTYGWGLTIQRATGEDVTFPGAPGSNGPVPGGNLIVNGDFRDNPLPSTAPYGDLGSLNGWTSNNDFELFNVGERGWAIDTDIAYAATPDEQSQSVQTEAGKLYDLTFDYKTAQDSWTPTTDDFDVLWNGNVVGTFSPDGKVNWLGGKVQVTGTGGMDTLTFREKGENDAGGSLVANVRLQEAMGTSPPPPPGAGPAAGVDVLGGAGRFENPNLTNTNQRLTSFEGWSTTGAGAILIDGTNQWGLGMDPAGQIVELSGPNQVLSRSVNTVAGQNYRLSLDFSAGDSNVAADARFEVLWNGQVVGTFSPADADWETRQLNVTGTGGADTLAFRSLNTTGSSNDGAWIDNVTLEANPTPTGANLMGNGSFESGLTGWTQSGVGLVNDATRASNGTQTTILSSSNNGAGWSMSTNVSGTAAGQAYALEFDYGSFGAIGSGPESGVRAIVKDAGGNVLASRDFYDSTQQNTGAGIYQKGRLDFGATGANVTVEFVDINSGNAITDSMLLDNVSVRAIPGAVSPPPPPPTGNILVNGSFEATNVATDTWAAVNTPGWTGITNSTLEIQEFSWAPASAGAQNAELSNGGFKQTVNTQAGQNYQLSFAAQHSSDGSTYENSFEVWWNGSKVGDVNPVLGGGWNTTTLNLAGTGGAADLEFRMKAGALEGAMIDNVQMVATGSASPGPTSPAPGTEMLVNGSFNSFSNQVVEYGPQSDLYQNVTGWTSTADSNSGVANNAFEVVYTTATGRTNAIDLDMETVAAADTITQTVQTEADRTYDLSFTYETTTSAIANGGNSAGFEVLWNGTVVGTYSPTDTSVQTRNLQVLGTGGQDSLTFREIGNNDGYGAILSDVSLKAGASVGGSSPAPSAFSPSGPTGTVNATTASFNDYRTNPTIAALADGGTVVAWQEGSNATQWTGKFQRYDASGAKVGAETTFGQAGNPEAALSVAGLAGGGFVVAYQSSFGNPTDGWDSLMRQYDANGNAASGPYQISSGSSAGDQINPTITALADGGFAVAWDHRNTAGSGNYDIAAAFFNANMTSRSGGNITVAADPADNEASANITQLSDGRALVTWTEGGQISGRFYNAQGSNGSTQFTFVPPSSNARTNVNVDNLAATSDGGFVLSWTDSATSQSYMQKFNSAGTGVGNVIQVAHSGQTGAASSVSVEATNDGGFVMAYKANEFGNTNGIFARTYNASGTAVGDVARLSQNANAEAPNLVKQANGDIVAVWQEGGGNDVGTSIKRVNLSNGPANLLAGKGDFANPDLGQNSFTHFNGSAGGWTTTNRIEIQQNGTGGAGTGTGDDQYMELDGNISTTMQTQAGQAYNIAFDFMKGNDGSAIDQQFEVVFNGNVVGTFDGNNVNSWQNGNVSVTGTGGTDTLTFRKMGSTTPWEGAFIDSVTMTAANGVSPPAVPAQGTNILVNGDFEADSVATGGVQYITPAGWTQSGAQQQFHVYDTFGGAPAASGSQYGEVATNAVQQSVATQAGRSYTIEFDSRFGNDGNAASNAFEVLWNGQVVSTVSPALGDQTWRQTSVNVTGTGGNDTLMFRRVTGSSMDAAWIDDVKVIAGAAVAPELVTNGGFEADNIATGSFSFQNVTGWTGITGSTGELRDESTSPQGQQNLELMNGGTRQSINTEAGKIYELNFASRAGWDGNAAGHAFEVWYNGQIIADMAPQQGQSWRNSTFTFRGAGGPANLEFRMKPGQENAQGAMIDAVSVREALPSSSPNLLRNGSFEANDQATGDYIYLDAPLGWTASNPGVNEVADTWEGVPGTDGTQWMEFSSNTLSQAVTTQVGQAYTFSFDYRGGDAGTGDQQRFRVRVNGVLVDQVDANGVNNWASESYTFIGSGNDTVQFERLSGGKDTGIWLDNVAVRAQTVTPPPPPTVGPNIVTNGSFETDNVATGSYTYLLAPAGWTASNAGVNEVADTWNGIPGSDGPQWMEFSSTTLSQALTTQAGQNYTFSFDYRGGDAGTGDQQRFRVRVNGQLLDQVDANGINNWASKAYTFTASGNDTIQFERLSGGKDTGVWLDNVQVLAHAPPAGPVAAGTNIITNGSFEATNVANNSSADVTQAGWTTVLGTNAGRVDTLDYAGAPDGRQYAELDQAGGYKTTLNTDLGRTYTLDFDFKNNANGSVADNQFEVWWNGSKIGEYGPGAGQGWTNGQLSVVGTGGAASLEFRTRTNTLGMSNFNGAHIDDVKMIAGAAPSPPAPGGPPPPPPVVGPPSADIASRTYGTSLIQDGGFEALTAGFTSSLGSSPWQSTTGMAEVINPAMEGPGGKTFLNGGQRFVELDMGMAQDDLFQDVQTEAGKVYQLDFNIAGRGNQTAVSNTLEVLWNDEVVGTATVDSTGNWTTSRLDVIGTGGTDRLTFRETAGGNNSEGPFIDNVRLREVTNAPVDNPNDGPGILGMTGANWGTGGSMRVVDMTSAKAGDKFSMIVNDKKEKTFTITNSMTLRELAAQVQREMGTAGTASVVMGPKGWRIDMDPKRGNRVEVFAGSVKGNALDDLGLAEGVARKIGTSKDSKRPAFVSGVVGGQTVSRGDGVNGIFRGAKGINAKAIAALDFDPTLKLDDKTLAKAATDALESSMRKVRLAYRQVNGELDAQTGGLPKAVFSPREAARMAQYQDALTKLQGGPTTSMLLGGF